MPTLRRHPISFALTAALVTLPAVAAEAPKDPAVLDTVEVEGQSLRPLAPLSMEGAKKRLAECAGGTTLVDAEALRQGRVSTLSDALGFAAGVFVQPRFGSDEARIAVRGSGLQRTFHGRGLVVLQDGIPINLADGGFDMQSIDALSARYIEVWRGPNALEYGAATLGGAINYVSPTGYDIDGTRLRAEAGSFGYGRWQAQWGGHSGAHDAVVSLGGFAQDGYRANARQENHRLGANWGYRFSDTLDARVYLTHVDTRSALPGSLTRAQFLANPRQAAAGNVRLDQRRDFELTRASLRVAYRPEAGRELLVSAFASDKFLDHPIFQVLQQDSLDRGIDVRVREEGEINGRRNVFAAGVGHVRGNTRDDRWVNRGRANPDDHRGARTDQSDQLATSTTVFFENQHWLGDRWVAVVGAQALSAQRRFEDRFPVPFDASFDRTYNAFSPKLGLRFEAAEGVQWFANLSRSAEPPSFGELAGGPNVTLVDLQRADSGEIGLRYSRDGLDIDAVAYRANVKNELLALTDGIGNPLGTRNADRTIHQGLEFYARWAFAPQWQAGVNALVNDFRFDGDAVFGDNELAGLPREWLRAELVWAPSDAIRIAPNVEWVPNDYFIDHANTFTAPGYAIWGLKVSGRFSEGLSWFVDGRNLGDRAYVATTGVVADTRVPFNPANPTAARPPRDGAYYLPGDGRSVYVGLEWRL